MSRRVVAVVTAAALAAGCHHDDRPRARSAAEVVRALTDRDISLPQPAGESAHHAFSETPGTLVDVFLAQSARRRLATEAADRALVGNASDGEVLCGGVMVLLRRRPSATTNDTAELQRRIDVALRAAFGQRCERATLPN
jgi:hypothetical protein